MTFGRGFLPSPPDSRDYPIERLLGAAAPPPEQALGLVPYVSIHDQGQTSSCVSFAIAQALRVYLRSKGFSEDFWPSTRFHYYLTLERQGSGIVDGGLIPRFAFQVLSESGFCKEEHWGWDPSGILAAPLPDTYTFASDQAKKTQYYRFFGSGDDLVAQIKSALAQGYPVVWGGPISKDYEVFDGAGTIKLQAPPFEGGHMRCLVGYNSSYAIESNSWGTGWGSSGFGFIDWGFIADAPSIGYEFWAVTYVPSVTG